jgi:hypothetical protein
LVNECSRFTNRPHLRNNRNKGIKPGAGGDIKTEKIVSKYKKSIARYLKLGKEREGKCRKIYENETRQQQNILKGNRGKTRTPTSICVIAQQMAGTNQRQRNRIQGGIQRGIIDRAYYCPR